MSVTPPITVGLPVYNGSNTIRQVLNSLLSQSFTDFILVISDNASTDDTGTICQEYASIDSRVRYIRQSQNIGAEANFRFVFQAALSEYFMWAAADDIRSPDFLERNLMFLREHPDYLGSTCPVRFQGRPFNKIAMGDASLADDDPYQRLTDFFVTWHANGRFYSLFRRAAIADWLKRDAHFLGSDWTLITHLAATGKLNRVDGGWVELGLNGLSNTTDVFALFRKSPLDWILPFNRLSRDTWRLMSGAPLAQRVLLVLRLARLNTQAFVGQFRLMVQKRKNHV